MDKYSELTQKIIEYICDGQKQSKEVKKKDILDVLKQKEDSNMSQYLEDVDKSEIKDFVRGKFEFFLKNYFDYVEGKVDMKPYINKRSGSALSGIKDLYEEYKNDLYYKEFKELYSKLDLDVLLTNHYSVEQRKFLSFKKYIAMKTKVCYFCQSKNLEYTETDHFLPKKYFPVLSIYTANLVGMCKKCNSRGVKGEKFKIPILHPYNEKKNLLADNVKFVFKGFDKVCVIEYDKSQNAVVNYIELFQIEKRFCNLDFLNEFNIVFSSIIIDTKRVCKERNERSFIQVCKHLDEAIQNRKRQILDEKNAYYTFFSDMLDTIDLNTKKKRALVLSKELIQNY